MKMCGRYELISTYRDLPSAIKKNTPRNFKQKYRPQSLIKPYDPVLVLKNEGQDTTSIMMWGFISQWAKNPFDKNIPKPFNARSETVAEKKLFKNSWKYKRCLIPATAFFEKDYRISRNDRKLFWLGGIWNKWISSDGSEIESCCILTTSPNKLIEPIHNRCPIIIPNSIIDYWLDSNLDLNQIKTLQSILLPWDSKNWSAEKIKKKQTLQLNLF